MNPDKCARCGKDPADGHAYIGDARYCHGDYDDPTCYMLASQVAGLQRLFDDSTPQQRRQLLRWLKRENIGGAT